MDPLKATKEQIDESIWDICTSEEKYWFYDCPKILKSDVKSIIKDIKVVLPTAHEDDIKEVLKEYLI